MKPLNTLKLSVGVIQMVCLYVLNVPYFINTRKQFCCKHCEHTFSVTSGTIFASHKKPLKIYLIVIALFTNAVKSLSALQLSRDLDVQYKTAWVLSQKIRESLMLTKEEEDEKLSGVCEIDDVYVGNYIRPANNIDDRVDRRKAHKPKKRVVISIRQRADSEFDEVVGAVKTKTFIVKSEEGKDIQELVYKNVE